MVRIKSSTRTEPPPRTAVRKPASAVTGAQSSHLVESSLSGLRGRGPVRSLSRCLGSLRNPSQSSPPRTASRGSQCTGYCLGETTCDTEQAVRRPGDKTRPLVFSSPWDHGPSHQAPSHHTSVYTQPRAAGHHLMGHRGASAEPRWVCGPLPASSPSRPPGVSPRLPLGLLPGPLPPGLPLLLLQPFLLLARQIWVQAQGTGSGLRVTGRAEG